MSPTPTGLRLLPVAEGEEGLRALSEALAGVPGAELLPSAPSIHAGLRAALQERPDCVLLDLPARALDGLALVRLLMRRQPTPVLVVARAGLRKQVAFRALEAGALDVVEVPAADGAAGLARELRERLATVRALAPGDGRASARVAPGPDPDPDPAPGPVDGAPPRVAVIGASTGGPSALARLLAAMPHDAPLAWAVAQHMPARFTASFAERLARSTGLDVREARDGDALAPGRVLVAPGGRHLRLVRAGPRGPVRAAVAPPGTGDGDRYCPSVDALFASAAEACGGAVCAVVLTGMGDDGRRGVERVKAAGGLALAESESSAVVYGMPRQAAETGLVDEVLPLDGIVARLRRFAEEPR